MAALILGKTRYMPPSRWRRALASTEEGNVPIDGEAVVVREKVSWLQRLIPEA